MLTWVFPPHRREKRITFHFSSSHFTLLPQRATVKEHIYKCVTKLGSAFQKHLNHFTHRELFCTFTHLENPATYEWLQ